MTSDGVHASIAPKQIACKVIMAPPSPSNSQMELLFQKSPCCGGDSVLHDFISGRFLLQCNRNEIGEGPEAPRRTVAIALNGKPAGREPAPSPLIVRTSLLQHRLDRLPER